MSTSQILPTSLAAGNAVSPKNVQFGIPSEVLTRKNVIIATYDPAKTAVVPEVPFQIFSPEEVGDLTGFGFMAHRLAERVFEGSSLETWLVPQAEVAGAAATGTITITATSAQAGTLALYIAGIRVPIAVIAGNNGDAIATAMAAAITANKKLPVSAVVNGITTNQVDITAKSKGPWGDKITLEFDLEAGDEQPSDITSIVVVDMTGGSGTPVIADALNALGIGDNQNEKDFTRLYHGYGQDTTTLNSISTYNGVGNTAIGNYGSLVARPFASCVGDIAPGTAGLSALIVIGDARKNDRTNGILGMPDVKEHPDEAAALAGAKCEQIAARRPAQNYVDVTLDGLHFGDTANRWTDTYTLRDNAVKAGISTTQVKSGVLTIQNMVTFYHPDSVPSGSNGFRDVVNVVKIQNMLNLVKLNFAREKWQGIFIVNDTAEVTDPDSREKARDISSVEDDLLALADEFIKFGLIFTPQFTKDKIAAGGQVTLRSGGLGFDNVIPVILSGAGGIMNTEIQFDANVSVAFG